jgi:nicotinamidase-related amidase
MAVVYRLLPIAVLAAAVGLAAPLRAQDIVDDWAKVEVPPAPKLEEVTVDPKTTALLMLDFLKQNCGPNPRCTAALPKVQPLLAAAREKKMLVVYSKFPSPSPSFPAPTVADILPPVAPMGKEPVVTGYLDKFLGTNLDKLLKGKHIKTVILVGNASNGAVLFTAASAFFRGYDVVVPVDGLSARVPYADQSTVFDFVNVPVMGGKVKLTRASMVKF